MKSRLFWKIFWNFCLTFLLQLSLMGAVFALATPSDPRLTRLIAERSAPQALALAERLVRIGGPAALPRDGPVRIAPADAVRPADEVRYARSVAGPDGRRYRLTVALPAVPLVGGIITPGIYLIGLVTGLASAALLAFYLTRPIRILRAGFAAFSAGDLDTRLTGRIGRRRDEIADLARDFDGMADEIEQLVRARDRLLDDVSHELRSPLARLQLAIALARQNPQRRGDALDRIEREAVRLDAMVTELLTLSRLESGAPLIEGYVDLAGLIDDLAADVRFEGAPRAVTVVLDDRRPAAAAIEMPGDPELIRRAFENVLRNALRFSPSPGTIAVTLDRTGDRATVAIADDGPGVSLDRMATLFDPFVKGSDGGGWGLGLAIARRAIVAHGGTIEASNAERGGLRITIILPLSLPT